MSSVCSYVNSLLLSPPILSLIFINTMHTIAPPVGVLSKIKIIIVNTSSCARSACFATCVHILITHLNDGIVHVPMYTAHMHDDNEEWRCPRWNAVGLCHISFL